MLSAARFWLSDVGDWLRSHRWVTAAIVVGALAGGAAAYLAISDEGDEAGGPAPAPQVVVAEVPTADDTDDLGFPAFATKNTTRVAGADPVADAAAVALAVNPSTGGVPGPDAVTLVDAGEWQAAIAAASLVGAPVGAPLLVTEAGTVPSLTGEAIRRLGPEGSSATAGRQVFVIGAAAAPEGYESLAVEGGDAAELGGGGRPACASGSRASPSTS